MSYPICLIFALLPSIIWLLFYLRKDVHPESKRMILKIFFYGMLAAIPAIFLELGNLELFKKLNFWPILILLLNTIVGVALVEEFLKYSVVKIKVLRDPEFDEPLDVMIYMIVAALGFAALENILILTPLGSSFLLGEILTISAFRFIGATFLHALCSGLLGFFMALSIRETEKRLRLLLSGLGIAVLLHGLYNFSIIRIESNLKLLIPVLILTGLAIFVTFGFKRLKKIKSVCLPDLP